MFQKISKSFSENFTEKFSVKLSKNFYVKFVKKIGKQFHQKIPKAFYIYFSFLLFSNIFASSAARRAQRVEYSASSAARRTRHVERSIVRPAGVNMLETL